eukprot:363183-Chlamydomonas_euryale.AAC.1
MESVANHTAESHRHEEHAIEHRRSRHQSLKDANEDEVIQAGLPRRIGVTLNIPASHAHTRHIHHHDDDDVQVVEPAGARIQPMTYQCAIKTQAGLLHASTWCAVNSVYEQPVAWVQVPCRCSDCWNHRSLLMACCLDTTVCTEHGLWFIGCHHSKELRF